MKCEICGKQTTNTVNDGDKKRVICEDCYSNAPAEPNANDFSEKLPNPDDVKCVLTIGITKDETLFFNCGGSDPCTMTLAGLIQAADIIIKENLKEYFTEEE